MTDTAHAEFEIAIERELHGALDQAEVARLAEHLLGCTSCRAYQRTAVEMEANMTAIGTLFSEGVVWGRVRGALDEYVRKQRAASRFSSSRLLNFVLVPAVLLSFFFIFPARRWAWVALFEALYALGLHFAARYARRHLNRFEEAAQAAQSTDEIFLLLDAKNRKEARKATWGLAALAIEAPLLLPLWFVPRSPIYCPPFGWFAAAALVFGIAYGAQELLRLRRERAAFFGP